MITRIGYPGLQEVSEEQAKLEMRKTFRMDT